MATQTPAPVIIQPKSNLTPVYIIGGAVIAFLGYKEVKKFLENQETAANIKSGQASTVKPGTKDKSGQIVSKYDISGKPVSTSGVNIDTIATDLYNALHPGWYKPTDQERVLRVFNTTPLNQVKTLENIYFNKYKESLKEVLGDKLNDVNFIKIKYYFR